MKKTEITVQLFENKESYLKKLDDNGFKFDCEFELHDYYYSKYSKDELRKFSYDKIMKNSILIRKITENNKVFSQIIYKDKEYDENCNVIAEEKIKSSIEDIDSAIKILGKAGLVCWCEFVQNNTVYSNGTCELDIQEIDGLGTFIEYEEDNTISNFNEKDKIKIMLNNLHKLNFKIGEDYSCKKNYMIFLKEDKL